LLVDGRLLIFMSRTDCTLIAIMIAAVVGLVLLLLPLL
jgi:hypothetical protein